MKHVPDLTTAQRLMLALASPRPALDDPSTASRRAERTRERAQAFVKRQAATHVTSPLIQNPDWTPGSPEPRYLATNRAARRARKADYRRFVAADARRPHPETEAGAELRAQRLSQRRTAAAQIDRGRIERAETAIEKWHHHSSHPFVAIDCHLASADRNTELLAALGEPA